MIEDVYDLIKRLPHLDYQMYLASQALLPKDGLYLFFERGEVVVRNDIATHRIVRVGINTGNGGFRKRLRNHYGHVRSLHGHKDKSAFRWHVGGALLNRENSQGPTPEDWLTRGKSFPYIEERVSQLLRMNFTFTFIEMDELKDRISLESGLIALLAQCPLTEPSLTWLGRYALCDEIKRSGLWNVDHVDGPPLKYEGFRLLGNLVKVTTTKWNDKK